MATERLLLIDFADMSAVRVKCKMCGSTSLLHLAAPTPIQQQCKCDWSMLSLPNDDPKNLARNLVSAVHQWQNQQSKPLFQLQFEVSLPK